MPVIVLGGIYSGIFTPTEAAAIACLYAIVTVLVQRTMTLEGLFQTVVASVLSSAAVLMIIAMTGVLNRALILNQVPQDLAMSMTAMFNSPLAFLLAVNALLLLIGMFMETNAAVLLMGPLLAPSAQAFGIDPIHFAIVVVCNIEIGLLTPPLAANIYVAARANNVELLAMMRHFGWFVAAAIIGLGVITFVPQISLWYKLI